MRLASLRQKRHWPNMAGIRQPLSSNRSYKVRFDKIEQALGFSCDWDLAAGAKQLHEIFEAIQLDAATFYGRGHTRLKQIEWLVNTGQVDAQLFWKKVAA